MSWSTSDRRSRFNSDWARTRRMILDRDHYRCRMLVVDEYGGYRPCGRPATDVDHIHRALNGVDDDSPENLQSLCRWHHQQKTAQESAEQRRVNRDRRREAEWYSHPAFR